MKVKDKKPFELFQQMQQNLKIFSIIPAKEMDTIFYNTQSERTLSGYRERTEFEDLATQLYGMYANTWDNLTEFYTNKALQDLMNTEKHTDEITDNIDTTSSRNELNKVSGFNSETMVDKDNSDVSETGTHKGTRTVTKTIEKVNAYNLEYIQKYLKVKLLYDIIFIDVKQYITLNIYEREC